MSLPLAPLNPGSLRSAALPGVGAQAAAERVAPVAALPAVAASSRELGARAGAPGRAPGVHPAREPGLQQRVGSLQQGLSYLAGLEGSLQDLKRGLVQSLSQGQRAATGLDEQLQAVQRQWTQRGLEAGAALDARLSVLPDGEAARRQFRLRGLDLQSLAQPGSETLRLSLPGQPLGLNVPLDGRGLQPALQSLQRALAPVGLRVDSRGGQLQFSVPETDWPALRDGLGIRGDGKRFPSGQPVRALLETSDEALQPARWQVGDADAQRRSLSQLVQAEQRVVQARQGLERELAVAGETQGDAGDAAAMAEFAATFARAPVEPGLDYGRLAALTPALAGLHRAQVGQLLLPAGTA